MKVLTVSSSDLEGGAARAAYRLHKGLMRIGVESRMLVQQKISDDFTVLARETKIGKGLAMLRPTLDLMPVHRYKNRDRSLFSPAWLPFSSAVRAINSSDADIVHLHWINGGFLRPEDIARIKKPIVW